MPHSYCRTSAGGYNNLRLCLLVHWWHWSGHMGQSHVWWWQLPSTRSIEQRPASLSHLQCICCCLGRWDGGDLGRCEPRWWQHPSCRSAEECVADPWVPWGICCDSARWHGCTLVKTAPGLPQSMAMQQEPIDWRYLLYIRPIFEAYVREYPSKIWPYMVQYLHFRILKFPLTQLVEALQHPPTSRNSTKEHVGTHYVSIVQVTYFE